MFHYLNNPKILKTTNGIEGFFSHLKNHLDLHRGFTLEHRVNFIKWYDYKSAWRQQGEFLKPLSLAKKEANHKK